MSKHIRECLCFACQLDGLKEKLRALVKKHDVAAKHFKLTRAFSPSVTKALNLTHADFIRELKEILGDD